MPKTTLITEDQIYGKDRLKVMWHHGPRVAATDLAFFLGADIATHGVDVTVYGDLACQFYYVSSDNTAGCMLPDKRCFSGISWERDCGVRPVLLPSETAKIAAIAQPKKNNPYEELQEIRHSGGIKTVTYGEYPQTVADENISEELEKLYQSKFLRSTGKTYTFDSMTNEELLDKVSALGTDFSKFKDTEDIGCGFKPSSYTEYELNGKKYIRIDNKIEGKTIPSSFNTSKFEYISTQPGPLWHDTKSHVGPYWIEVKPIEWLVDPSGTWISKKCLFASIPYDSNTFYKGDFSKTFMAKYLREYFDYEMLPTEEYLKAKGLEKPQKKTSLLRNRLAKGTQPSKVSKKAKVPKKTKVKE